MVVLRGEVDMRRMAACVRALVLAVSLLGWSTASGVEPLLDPIPQKIEPGDIVVGVEDFVRVPKTPDSGEFMVNDAWARIQYMVPFGYTSGPLLINDTRGVLYKVAGPGAEPTVYLDLREQDVGFDDSMFPNEMGVSGVAFHPEFTSIGKAGFGKFYTAYSATSDSGVANYLEHDAASHESVIREWTTFNPRGATFEGTSREIFRVGQFAPNHNVGAIAFNPLAEVGSADYGVLYASFGDGGAANDPREYGQSLASPLSTIIRINPLQREEGRAYGIPEDNPFKRFKSAAPEIYVWGLRHSQHFSWDTQGRLFLSDIGQARVEEVNIAVPGGNYGWRLREGMFATAFAVEGGEPGQVYPLPAERDEFIYPIAQYDHDEGYAIGGGYVYEGNAIPALKGMFVFTDIVNGRVFYFDASDVEPGKPAEIRELRLSFNGKEKAMANVTGVANTYDEGKRVDLRLGIDALGELYLLSKSDGWVRKLVPPE